MDTNLDILITRVIDGRATPADWESLETLGAGDAAVWRELALAQKADQLLKGAVARDIAAAELVDLPANVGHIQAQERMNGRLRRVGAWGGWAAAAALTFAFLGHGAVSNSKSVQPAGLDAPFASAADAWKAYMEKGKKEGRVIGELPDRVVVNTQEAQDGKGYEIVFVRQIMERTKVDDLYKVSQDEAGNPHAVKVQFVVSKSIQ